MNYRSFVQRNGDGAWRALCGCGWRSGTFEGVLAEFTCADELDEHKLQHAPTCIVEED